MSKMLKKVNPSNPKLWLLVGAVVVVAETRRRRRRKLPKPDFGAFVERFELLPIPQPNQTQTLSALTFAIKDIFDVKGYVTGFGNPQWKKMHNEAGKTAIVITALLSNGATCVGKTVMDEFSFGISGENKFYGTPTNPQMPSSIPGGSSSGSAVAVAARLVDFAMGTDTTGCVRIPAAFCGILGFRPSHGVISTIGVLPNAQSLDTVGWFARDPSVLHRVGLVLLPLNSVELKRTRRIIFADDLFQLCKAPSQKTVYIIGKAIENLSGYQFPQHMNLCQYIASNVPSLKEFREKFTHQQNGVSILKALTSVMFYLQGYEFKTNHEEWVKSVKPRLGRGMSERVNAAMNATHDNIKTLYKVRTEMWGAFQHLLKDDGILVIPTVADYPLKLNTEKGFSSEFGDRAFALSSIASISGCCQVAIPLGCHNDCCASVSLISAHGADKFLLNTVLDMYSTLQEQVSVAYALPLPDTNGSMGTSELLKEKGNAAFKGRLWNKAVDYYTEAINLNGTNATYYSNRAAAYLELGCFQEAEEDCNMAILHDKKNVKAYLRRGTARELLLRYKEALKDFQHALVLEPQNKTASLAEKRLRKSTS
ncbi:outer envelope protein 64, mitochondrial-like isoform X1 [Glycine soja]|uniref:Outer envelope protein 64, mitochondrial isoform A n=1 Tax=Glycine soja TaxID=3848 RepID=A0A445GPH2_GLYSO|nr:outer envelope protein 64, mitochondrial-like isoform X1 [Glycine soja]RZB63205.1 Outer envelope protein 64, mitochondrial isoform A [Glycine soja]